MEKKTKRGLSLIKIEKIKLTYKKQEEKRLQEKKLDEKKRKYIVLNAKLCRKYICLSEKVTKKTINFLEGTKLTPVDFQLNFELAERYFKIQYNKLSITQKLFSKNLKKLIKNCSAFSRNELRKSLKLKNQRESKKFRNKIKMNLNKQFNSSCEIEL